MISKDDVLNEAHKLVDDAFNEWILCLEDDKIGSGLWYINGVHDFADRLINLLEDNGNCDK